MRQIIFRAKRIDNGEWVQGDLVRNAFNGSSKVMDFGIQRPDYFPHEVDPETISQFTGLTDKNGVKIWEGDIMGGGHLGFAAAVTFNDGMFQLVTSAHQGNSPLVQDRASRIKVIGNIFDNPELLQ